MEQLMQLFGEEVMYECFHPDHTPGSSHLPPFRAYGSYNLQKATLECYNKKGYGIYFAINQFSSKSKRTEEYVNKARAIWLEDDGDSKHGHTDPSKFPLAPSAIIQSSPGKYHYYWFTETKDLEAWQSVMDKLCSDYNGDPGAKLKVQVLRVPGYINTKYKSNNLVIITGGNFKRYSWANIIQKFPTNPQPLFKKKNPVIQHDFSLTEAVDSLISGSSVYESCMSISMSLANKGISKYDSQAILSALLINSTADSDRIDNAQIKLPSLIDNAMAKIAVDKTAKYPYSPENMYTTLAWPPGKVGEVAQEINSIMISPSRELAICVAFHLISILGCGCYHFQGVMANRARTVLADSGRGKQTCGKYVSRVLDELPFPDMQTFTTGNYHTPFNTHGDLNTHRVRSRISDEEGIGRASKVGDKAGNLQYDLKILGKTVYDDPITIPERSRGNVANSLNKEHYGPVYCPILIILNESTPHTYMKAVLAEGFTTTGALAREELYFISPETEFNPDFNKNQRKLNPVNMSLYEALVRQYLSSNTQEGTSATLRDHMKEVDYSQIKQQLLDLHKSTVLKSGTVDGASAERALITRYVQRVMTDCLILAVADSCILDSDEPTTPVVTKEHWNYVLSKQDELSRCIQINAQKGHLASALDKALTKLETDLYKLSMGEDKDEDKLFKGMVTQGWVARKLRHDSAVIKELLSISYNDYDKARGKVITAAVVQGLLLPAKQGYKDHWINNVSEK